MPVKAGKELVGSCDGTSVKTRETSWREVKAYRFEHSGGKFGGAHLEKVEQFVSRMVEAADRMGAAAAGRGVAGGVLPGGTAVPQHRLAAVVRSRERQERRRHVTTIVSTGSLDSSEISLDSDHRSTPRTCGRPRRARTSSDRYLTGIEPLASTASWYRPSTNLSPSSRWICCRRR